MQQVFRQSSSNTQKWHIKTQEIDAAPPSFDPSCLSQLVMQKNDNSDQVKVPNVFHFAFLNAVGDHKPSLNVVEQVNAHQNALLNYALLTPVEVYNPSPAQDSEVVTQANQAQLTGNEAINRLFSQVVDRVCPPAPMVPTAVQNPAPSPISTRTPTVLAEKRVDNKPVSINNTQPKSARTTLSEIISSDNSENINPLYRANENRYSKNHHEAKASTKTSLIDEPPIEKKKGINKILAPITNLLYPKK